MKTPGLALGLSLLASAISLSPLVAEPAKSLCEAAQRLLDTLDRRVGKHP